MAKEAKPTETVEENLFANFNLLDQPVPTKTSETKEDTSKKKETKEDNIDPLENAKKEIDDLNKKKEGVVSEDTEEIEEEEQEIETSKEVEIEEDKESEFAVYAKHMSERGLLDLDETDKIESEEDLEKIQAKTIHNGIDKYKQSIPEDGQKFLEFIENGGNPADFHKYYYGDGSFENFDISEIENQKHAIREGLKAAGWEDDTEIEEEISLYEDAEKLESKAKSHLSRLQKLEKEQKDLLLEAQRKYAKEQEDLRVQEWDKFKKGLFDKEAISGFKLTPKVKQDLWDYMTKPINKKTGETEYQKDSKLNEDARYMFALLLKNKWDVKSLEKQVESKQISKLKSKLNSYSDSKQKVKGSADKTIEEKDKAGFSAFRTMLNS